MPESLQDLLSQVRARVVRYRRSSINEDNTKAILIDPVLRALGWNLEDLDEVHREYKPKSADNPVDYALFVLGSPRLFLEAKALGENLSDRRWANQIMGYAAVAGVEWVVLTNGDEYRVYNAHAAVPVDEKIFRTIRVTDEEGPVYDTLMLLSKEQMQQKQIESLWTAHFVDRQVRGVIESFFSPQSDLSFVNLLRRRLPNMSAGQIKASLQRLQVRFDAPPHPSPPQENSSTPLVISSSSDPVSIEKESVSLQDLISLGLVHAPLTLHKTYKGHLLTARVELDGRISYQDKTYNSLSVAAGMARRSIVGSPPGRLYPQTNGWTFWHFTNGNGASQPMDVLREQYAKERPSAAS